MKRLIILTICLVIFNRADAQKGRDKNSVIYVVDNIPFNPSTESDLGELTEDDVFEQKIITNQEELKKLGYSKANSLILITTKPFNNRREEDKIIPTTRLMIFTKEGGYKKANIKYSGIFKDYYLNGKVKMEGEIDNGKLMGIIKKYYNSGTLLCEETYVNGLKDGSFVSYHLNGNISEKGSYKNLEHIGLYQQFYSTGKLALELTYEKPTFTNNQYSKPISSKKQDSVSELISHAVIEMTAYSKKEAIKLLNISESIDQGDAQIYFYRAMAWYQEKNIDNAEIDFHKALKIEPLYGKALLNMAMMNLQKFDQSVRFEKGSFVLIEGNKAEVPKEFLDLILTNIRLSIEIGEAEQVAFDVLDKYKN